MAKIRDTYLALLREWMGELLSLMVHDPAHRTLDGAILCPACSVVHGRCADAIYPFLCLYAIDRKPEYLEAARKLFAWSEYMLCDDGSMYNDSQSQWQGTTVFSALGLYHALRYHGNLLEGQERLLWEERLKTLAGWLKGGIRAEGKTNVNYIAANAAAMELIGAYFQNGEMRALARELALTALSRVGKGGLLFGEGSPLERATPRGMSAVDAGYNAEETLPCLYEYAESCGDAEIMERVLKLARAHLALMLPDGAWDNSFGSRNFKWTYWGSRTADGCQAMFNALGRSKPAFAEAALRNLLLYRRCTKGLLYGGVDYLHHGEQPCAHHAFCAGGLQERLRPPEPKPAARLPAYALPRGRRVPAERGGVAHERVLRGLSLHEGRACFRRRDHPSVARGVRPRFCRRKHGLFAARGAQYAAYPQKKPAGLALSPAGDRKGRDDPVAGVRLWLRGLRPSPAGGDAC